MEDEGDHHPDFSPGDLIFHTVSIVDPTFTRNGNNLYANMIITLDEALYGFSKQLKHLDGKAVAVESKSVTQPGFVLVIPGKGMPFYSTLDYGNLYVDFTVLLPENPLPKGTYKPGPVDL